jgi:UDP-glucuronate 4-epimerase
VIEFVNTLAEVLGQQPQINYAPMQKADVALTCASEERLLSLIGDWPDTPLREGLQQFVDWLKGWDPMP